MSGPAPLADVLATLAARGVALGYEGDRLRFRAPKGALDTAQRALLSGQRASVIAALRQAAAERVEEFPLSAAQTGMWFTQQQAPASGVCTIGFALRVTGKLDVRGVELPELESLEEIESLSDVADEELEDSEELVAAEEGPDAD